MRYMAYAECAFILAALLTAGIGGVTILQRRTDGAGKLMGGAALTLCAGEALSLLPRAAHRLGFLPEPGLGSLAGRMAAAVAVSVLCILLSLLWEKLCGKRNGFFAEMHIRELSGARALACLFPVVVWLSQAMGGEKGNPLADSRTALLAVAGARGLTLLIVAAIVAYRWYKTRDEVPTLKSVWWLLGLGAILEIAADFGAVLVPALEWLYIPELVCFLGIVLRFVRYSGETGELH